MKAPEKWAMLRVSQRTHKLLLTAKKRAGISMSELVRRLVQFIYSEEPMQALTFYMIYFDDKASFIVASKDASTAELGVRQQLLGQTSTIKKVKAAPLMEADKDDVLRVGIAAIMTQQAQTNAVLQAIIEGGRRGR